MSGEAYPRPEKCPECKNSNFIFDYEQGEIVCRSCGHVIYDRIEDLGPERGMLKKGINGVRVGAPMTYAIHDKGLSTTIGWVGERTSAALSPADFHDIMMLKKWQKRSQTSSSIERNLITSFSQMSKISSLLNLPKSTLETASIIYREVLKKRSRCGRSLLGMTAACLYMACRKTKVARSLKEIADASGLSKKEVAKFYRRILRILKGEASPPLITDYVSRFANQLDLAGQVETIAIEMSKLIKSLRLTIGRGPAGIAAAITYIASIILNKSKTQREIAKVAGITEVTIRNRYKELLENLDIVIKV